MLLPDDSTLDEITKKRYQKFLSSKIKKLSFSKEANNIENSCSSAINWLIAQTRDVEKFPLIREESINFGFVKNLYGLKPIGIIISTFLTITELVTLFIKFHYGIDLIEYPNLIASFIISLSCLTIWIFAINKDLVVYSGNKYARALLSACDSEMLNS